MRYSKHNELVLDQFIGGGTTLVEAKLLGRNAIGTDINAASILISETTLNFHCEQKSEIHIRQCDARNLDFIENESIDLICTHPPYANIIKYSKDVNGDISLVEYPNFISEIMKVAIEAYRVLKSGKVCAIMMGDIRRHGRIIPLGFQVMECFLKAGFKSKEIIIKEQHNCKSTQFWSGKSNNFLLIAHEYIFIFEK